MSSTWVSKKPVVIKPAVGNGSRGIRILDESCNRYDLLFNHKPSSLFSNLNDVVSAVGSGNTTNGSQ